MTSSSPETLLAIHPCAVCDKTLEAADGNPNFPERGVTFATEGGYNSSAFDSVFGGEHLEIFICDDCLKAMRAKAIVSRIEHGTKEVPTKRVIWGSEEDKGNNPWNNLRLRNGEVLDKYLDDKYENKTYPSLSVREMFDLCNEATDRGDVFSLDVSLI